MAQKGPKKLTPEQKEKLKDPRFAMVLRAIRPLQKNKRQPRAANK